MAAQTVSVNRNFDDAEIAGLLNGEAVTIDTAAVLTCDSDNRWSQQAAVLGSSSISSLSGGKIAIDGRNVWQVPFSASTGNVPALGTVGVQDSTGETSLATGEFLGVWATDEMIPHTAGGAMPATGYVKFRSKVGTFTGGEIITLPGLATITTTNAGKRSWINFASSYQGTFTVPRLGLFEALGDWFDLGTTNGLNDQEFDWPFLDICNGIQIETAAGSGVYEWFAQAGGRWVSATETIDTDDRGKYFGQRAADVVGDTTSGSPVVLTTATTQLIVGMPINASAGFSNLAAYIVSINPGVSFTVNANSNATGTGRTFTTWRNKLQLASSVAPVMGFLPPTGCKVRCPNTLLSTSISPFAGNITPTSQTDRYEFVTTASGQIVMDTVDCAWYANCAAPYSLDFRRVSQALGWIVANVATTTYIDDCITSHGNGSATTGLAMSNCYGGGEIKNSRIARYSAGSSGAVALSMVDCSDFVITDCELRLGGTTSTSRLRGNASIHAILMTRCFRIDLVRPSFITGKCSVLGCIDVNITDPRFADLEQGTNPGATNSLTAAIDVTAGSANVYIEGFSSYKSLTNVHPYSAILNTATGCSNVEMRSVGTPAAPYDGGSANALRRVLIAAVTVGLVLRRVYAQNTATAFASIANTCQNVQLINCWADGGDTNAFAGVNQLNKGCRWTNSVTGQSAVYGSHWEDEWQSTTAGRIVIKCNEPTVDTAAQCAVTAGTAAFTSTGNVSMPTLGDQVTWEMPDFALGVTSLTNTAPTITGTNTGNFTLEFQADIGSGYSAWLPLTGADLSGIGAIAPATGVRLKIRATTATANVTNALTYIRVNTDTNSTDQQLQFPLPVVTNPATVSWEQAGSRVYVYNVDTATEIYNDVPAGLSLDLSYAEGSTFTVGDEVLICVRIPGHYPVEITTFATSGGWSAFAPQSVDVIYSATTPADITVDYVNLKIRATGSRSSLTAQELVDIIRNAEATVDGIRLADFAGISGLVSLSPGVSTAITVNLIDWQVSWASGSVAQATIGGGNIVGGLLGDPVEDVVGGPQVTVNVSAAATVITTGGSIPTAADNAAAVWAYIVRTLTSGGGGGGLTAQQTRDALLLAPTGSVIAGSVDAQLATIISQEAPSAATNAAAVRSELTTELARIDVAVSSRNSVAPDNANIAAIKAKTDNIPAVPATEANVTAVGNAVAALNDFNPATDTVARVTLVDTTTTNTDMRGTDGANTVAPDNANISAIKAKTDNLPTDPADNSEVLAAIAGVTAPTAAANASAVRAELATELARVDVAISTRNAVAPDNTSITAIKKTTSLIPGLL